MAPMLASRGCLYDCAFCTIQEFYRGAPGPPRRTRSPGSVVAEMRELYERQDVRLFVFEDDDFASRSAAQRAWIETFLDELGHCSLRGRVLWMAACRVDEVDAALLRRCRDAGLINLFLGVESGNAQGLKVLGKRATVAQGLRAVEALKGLGLYFDMGFMLLDPESTVVTVRENIRFLRTALGDGSTVLPLVKTIPYAGTRIERQLLREGRLMGTAARPEYEFRDPRLNLFAAFAFHAFGGRGGGVNALMDRLWLARHDQMARKALGFSTSCSPYGKRLVELTALANTAFLDTLDATLRFVEARSEDEILADWSLLDSPLALLKATGCHLDAELGRLLHRYGPHLVGQHGSIPR